MKRLLPLLLIACTSTAAIAENVKIHSKKIGGGRWTVSSWMDGTTREFTHCAATTEYRILKENRERVKASRVVVDVKLFNGGNAGFSIYGDGWRLVQGNLYQVKFEFDDDEETFEAAAVAITEDALQLEVPTTDLTARWYVGLARANRFGLVIENHPIGWFALQKSKVALEELMSCYIGTMEAVTDGRNPTFGSGSGEGD